MVSPATVRPGPACSAPVPTSATRPPAGSTSMKPCGGTGYVRVQYIGIERRKVVQGWRQALDVINHLVGVQSVHGLTLTAKRSWLILSGHFEDQYISLGDVCGTCTSVTAGGPTQLCVPLCTCTCTGRWTTPCREPLCTCTAVYRQVNELRAVYRSVEDVDLFVGGVAEDAARGALVGPVFQCLLAEQFTRLKYGDRHFYNHVGSMFSRGETRVLHGCGRKYS